MPKPNNDTIHERIAETQTETTKQKRPPDPELRAMARINRILDELEPECRARVAAWLASRWSRPLPGQYPRQLTASEVGRTA